MSHRLFGFIPVHLTHRALWLSPSGVKEQSRHISQVTGAALLCLYLFIIQVLFIHAVLLSQQIKLLKTACACLIQLPLSFIFDINKYELLSFNSGLSLTSHLSHTLFVSMSELIWRWIFHLLPDDIRAQVFEIVSEHHFASSNSSTSLFQNPYRLKK